MIKVSFLYPRFLFSSMFVIFKKKNHILIGGEKLYKHNSLLSSVEISIKSININDDVYKLFGFTIERTMCGTVKYLSPISTNF